MSVWENVRSHDEAEALRRQGKLEAVQLLPSELGGAPSADNVVLVPPQTRADKDAATAELLDIFRAGRADQLSVVPEYRGDSVVPAALRIAAWREGEPPVYDRRLEVWQVSRT